MQRKWIGLVVLCSSFFVLTGCMAKQAKPEKTPEVIEGVEKIASLNEKSVSTVQEEIRAIQREREEKRQEELKPEETSENEPQPGDHTNKNYKTLFQDSLILGDSLAEGFLDGDFLDPINVRADRGQPMYEMEEQVELVRSLSPKNIFLIYGMNDLEFCNGDASLFKERYGDFLSQLKEACPSAQIYMNLIFPVQDQILEERPLFKHIDEYNQALMELGQEMDVPVLDNHSLVTEEEYEPDGIHMKISFYPKWLDKMVEEAGLQ